MLNELLEKNYIFTHFEHPDLLDNLNTIFFYIQSWQFSKIVVSIQPVYLQLDVVFTRIKAQYYRQCGCCSTKYWICSTSEQHGCGLT